MPYTVTTWVNDGNPPLSAANLNKLTNELKLQAGPPPQGVNISNTLPTWVDGASPAITDAAPLNEMERVVQLVQQAVLPASPYTKTTWQAGWTPARNATRLNRLEAQAQANRAAIEAVPTTAYFVEDWSSGQAQTVRWDAFYSYSGSGFFATPLSATPDGRVAVVNDPAGGGGKCVRVEIRDADPDYPSSVGTPVPFDKSEIPSSASHTWNGSFSVGITRWFEWDIYLPYNVSEKFEWAHGGGQPYTALFGLHPPGGTGYSAIHLGWEAFQFNSSGDSYQDKNVFLNFHVEGGTFPETTYSSIYNLLRLTDGAGARVLANHNRWIHLVWGMKFNPDTTGWMEAWVDGANVLPRVNRPTMWSSDGQNYFKYGMYKRADATYPESGRSVIYYGRTTIGTARPF